MRGIRRLAQHLDISIGTVSRALNNKPDVSADTRARVLVAAKELGYVPNQAGRALRSGATGVVGFMMQTGADITSEGDIFFMSVFGGIQDVFARHQLDLIALLCPSNEDRDAYLRRVVARGFADALILSSTRRSDSRIEFLSERDIPFITLGRSLSDGGQPWLDLDFEGMTKIGVNRLISQGHKRIGVYVPDDDTNLGYIVTDSYRETLAAAGLEFDPDLIFRARQSERGGFEIARRIVAMQNRPTGFLLLNEMMTLGLYRGLADAGLVPGQDLAIIGRDSPQSHYLTPRLTCFSLSLRDLGIRLAESLLSTMPAFADKYPLGVVREVVKLNLIEGESG